MKLDSGSCSKMKAACAVSISNLINQIRKVSQILITPIKSDRVARVSFRCLPSLIARITAALYCSDSTYTQHRTTPHSAHTHVKINIHRHGKRCGSHAWDKLYRHSTDVWYRNCLVHSTASRIDICETDYRCFLYCRPDGVMLFSATDRQTQLFQINENRSVIELFGLFSSPDRIRHSDKNIIAADERYVVYQRALCHNE